MNWTHAIFLFQRKNKVRTTKNMCFPYCSYNIYDYHAKIRLSIYKYFVLPIDFIIKHKVEKIWYENYYYLFNFFFPQLSLKSCNFIFLCVETKKYKLKLVAPPQIKLELCKRKICLPHGTHLYYLLEYRRQGFRESTNCQN